MKNVVFAMVGGLVAVVQLGACSGNGDGKLEPDTVRAADAQVPNVHLPGDAGVSVDLMDGGAPCSVAEHDYAGFVAPLIEAACQTCHDPAKSGAERQGAPMGMDFNTESSVAGAAARIHLRAIEQATMPPGGPLDACDRSRLAAYLQEVGLCTPDCANKACGDDGCGGRCGECLPGDTCNTLAFECQSECVPGCGARECGDDGCGATCGAGCGGQEVCADTGLCQCVPQCDGKSCGPDGCGGSCGVCLAPDTCEVDTCACVPECGARECGDDGCGGSCGTCPGVQLCGQGQCVTSCTPDCGGKLCGDDGCGASCGTCSAGQACAELGCAYPEVGFAAGVYPILSTHGCGASKCHGGVKPSANLDLSGSPLAYAALVDGVAGCGALALVQPGAPGSSYLVNKLLGVDMCSGGQMPKAGSGLSSTELETVQAWIGAGALP